MKCNEMEMDVLFTLFLVEKVKKGGSPREGGSNIGPGRDPGGFFFRLENIVNNEVFRQMARSGASKIAQKHSK